MKNLQQMQQYLKQVQLLLELLLKLLDLLQDCCICCRFFMAHSWLRSWTSTKVPSNFFLKASTPGSRSARSRALGRGA